jgi:hypothetical protein
MYWYRLQIEWHYKKLFDIYLKKRGNIFSAKLPVVIGNWLKFSTLFPSLEVQLDGVL